jgi:predicted nucleic acid-binding protein
VDRQAAYEYIPTNDEHWGKAFAAQRALARTGRHRAVGITDLLTAVLSGDHRLTLVHYDPHFEVAAEVIDFDHRWIVERGIIAT